MRRKQYSYEAGLKFGDFGGGGPRGGRGGKGSAPARVAEPDAPIVDRMGANTSRLKNIVDRSVEEAGGFPTRGGKPMMTKMQERELERKRKYQEETGDTRNYAKGGMVK